VCCSTGPAGAERWALLLTRRSVRVWRVGVACRWGWCFRGGSVLGAGGVLALSWAQHMSWRVLATACRGQLCTEH
jgi:hypothetical protein